MSVQALNESFKLVSNTSHVWDDRDTQFILNIIHGGPLPQNIRHSQIASALNVRFHSTTEQKVKDTLHFYICELMFLDVTQTSDPSSRLWVGQTSLNLALRKEPKTDQERIEKETAITNALSYFMLDDPRHREVLINKYSNIYQACSVLAEYFFKNKDRDKAIEWLKKAADLNNTLVGMFNCGKLLISYGEKTLGIEYIQKAANSGFKEADEWLKKDAENSLVSNEVQIIDSSRTQPLRSSNPKRKTSETQTPNPRSTQRKRAETLTPPTSVSAPSENASTKEQETESAIVERPMTVIHEQIAKYNKNHLPTITERCNFVDLFLDMTFTEEEKNEMSSVIKKYADWKINNFEKDDGCPVANEILSIYDRLVKPENHKKIDNRYLFRIVDRINLFLNSTFTKNEIDFLIKSFMRNIEDTPEGIRILNKYNRIFYPKDTDKIRTEPPIQRHSSNVSFDKDENYLYAQKMSGKLAWSYNTEEEKYRYAEEAMYWLDNILQKNRNPYAMIEMSSVNFRIHNELISYQWAIRAASYKIEGAFIWIKVFAFRNTSDLPLFNTPLHTIVEKYVKCKI